jgi:hypothetical protein
MREEQFEVARELQELDGVENVYFEKDTLRARVIHGESVPPAKTDFPEELEEQILDIIENTWYKWELIESEHGDFREIEHAGRGHKRRHGKHWYPVLGYCL